MSLHKDHLVSSFYYFVPNNSLQILKIWIHPPESSSHLSWPSMVLPQHPTTLVFESTCPALKAFILFTTLPLLHVHETPAMGALSFCPSQVRLSNCYGYSIYDPHITYPLHYYKNLWYRESLSLYLLLNISHTHRVLPFKNPKTPFLFTLLYLLPFLLH